MSKVRYILRVHCPENMLESLIEFTKRANIEEVMFFVSPHRPDEKLSVLEKRAESLSKCIAKLKQLGIGTQINVTYTMQHLDIHDSKIGDFQTLVGPDGQASKTCYCPLDPRFLDWVRDVYKVLATTGAESIWLDDDLRYYHHPPLLFTCFCDLHMKALKKRFGHTVSREELVKELIKDEYPPSNVKRDWFGLNKDSILELARVVETAVHKVNPKMRVGLMSCKIPWMSLEGRDTDLLLRTLAGNLRPLYRPHQDYWNDECRIGSLERAFQTGLMKHLVGNDVQIISELENFPGSLFNKSFRIFGLQMAMNVIHGITDLSFSGLIDIHAPDEEGDKATFLAETRPFLESLAIAQEGKQIKGITVVGTEGYALNTRIRHRDLDETLEPRPWELILSRLGMPVGYTDSYPYILSRDIVLSLNKSSVREMLSKGAVLDAVAVDAVSAMGLEEMVGVKVLGNLTNHGGEILTEHELNDGIRREAAFFAGLRAVFSPRQVYHLSVTQPKAELLSEILDINGKAIAPGLVVFENSSGGRIMALPFTLEGTGPFQPPTISYPWEILCNFRRKEQFRRIIEWISRRPLEAFVENYANICPIYLEDPQTQEVTIGILNFSYDDAENLDLSLGQLTGERYKILLLRKDGTWKTSEMHLSKDKIGRRHLVIPNVPNFSLQVLQLIPS